MEVAQYKFFLLHSKRELLQETALLINKEWSRSLAARLASIEEGSDELPCSVVMVEEGGRVVGHARLMPVAGVRDAALIETVIVAPELRGRGLGRQLMEKAERHTVEMGYKTLHLSTHDKQGFYSRLGYERGPAVSGQRKCIARLSNDQAHSLLGGRVEESSETNIEDLQQDCSTSLPAPPPLAGLAPPPPPPPPKLLDTSRTVPSQVVTWMVKQLV